MTEFFSDIFQYTFLSNAVYAAFLTAVVCGLAGTYIVCRRMVFLSGGITHSSFGGIGIAYYLGYDPVWGALVFAVLSALGIEISAAKGKIREDSAVGIFWSVGMALGIIFIYMTPGYAPNLMSFLFGNILTVNRKDILLLGVLSVLLAIIFICWRRQLMFLSFDKEYSRSRGIPVNALSYIMAVFVSLAIVLSIKTVGIVMLISLLTIPPVIVNSLTNSYGRIALWSVITAAAGNLAGLWVSYKFDIPVGASTIFILTIALIIVKTITLLPKAKRQA